MNRRHTGHSAVLVFAAMSGLAVGGCETSTAPVEDSDVLSAENQINDGTAEWEFHRLLNQARNSRGLGSFPMQPQTSQLAREWSAYMAQMNNLHHRPNLSAEVTARVTNQWLGLGENVAVGGSIQSIHDALMNSRGHYANIVGDYHVVGIGVERAGNGQYWVTFNFIKAAVALSQVSPPAPPPAQVQASLDPFGALDGLSASPGRIRGNGWAIDPETASPISVRIQVNSTVYEIGVAQQSRPDVGTTYLNYGPNHGFSFDLGASPGTHNVCAYAINVGAGVDKNLGCKTITLAGRMKHDYDGDGRADLAFYRPWNGSWHIRNSSNDAYWYKFHGEQANGDIPLPGGGDYDGDGKADLAFYRPWNGSWHIRNSSNDAYWYKFHGEQANGDVPLPSLTRVQAKK